jgi:ELWxxDGT repeat protein
MVTSSTTLSHQSRVLVLSNSGDIDITLPEASSVSGRMYRIQKLDSKDVVTIGVASGNLRSPFIDVKISSAGKAELLSDGSDWHLVDGEGELGHPIIEGFGIIADINTNGNSSPQEFYEFGGYVYFQAYQDSTGTELWRTDGTSDGTTLVSDIDPGTAHSYPREFQVMGGELYFQATTTATGYELFKTDGTEAGTVLVKDIYSGPSSSSPSDLEVIGDSKLVFRAQDANGQEIWVSDGTEAGTMMLKDINDGASSSSPYYLTALANAIVFRATSSAEGQEIWITDGTTSGTNIIKDIVSGTGSSYPNYLKEYNGEIYFSANDGTLGYELWKTDGTEAGTVLVKDIATGPDSSSPEYFQVVDGVLHFSAYTSTYGDEPWVTDGSSAGTELFVDIKPGSTGSDVYSYAKVGDKIFMFDDNYYGLFVYEGGVLSEIKDFYVDYESEDNEYRHFYPLAGGVVFEGYLESGIQTSYEDEYNLWWTDGTEAGTFPITKSSSTSISDLTMIGDKIYLRYQDYNASNGWGRELYILSEEPAPPEPEFSQQGGDER